MKIKDKKRICEFPGCVHLGNSLGKRPSGTTKRSRWCSYHRTHPRGKELRLELNKN